MRGPDGEFTEAEIQELIDWLESLTVIDIYWLKDHWEKTEAASDTIQ